MASSIPHHTLPPALLQVPICWSDREKSNGNAQEAAPRTMILRTVDICSNYYGECSPRRRNNLPLDYRPPFNERSHLDNAMQNMPPSLLDVSRYHVAETLERYRGCIATSLSLIRQRDTVHTTSVGPSPRNKLPDIRPPSSFKIVEKQWNMPLKMR